MGVFASMFLLLAAVAYGGALMYLLMSDVMRERQEPLLVELDALQTAQRLGFAAWQARQDMAVAVREGLADVIELDPDDAA